MFGFQTSLFGVAFALFLALFLLLIVRLKDVLGIAHCHENGNACRSSTYSSNVMNPFLNAGIVRTTLTAYDKASLVNIYVLSHLFS